MAQHQVIRKAFMVIYAARMKKIHSKMKADPNVTCKLLSLMIGV